MCIRDSTQDIQMFKDAGIAARGEGNFVVFNGPDEQFVSGLSLIHIYPGMVAQPVGADQLSEAVLRQERPAVAAGCALWLQVQR